MRRTLGLFCDKVLSNGMKLSGTFSPRTSHLVRGIATMPDGRVFKGEFDETHGHPTGSGQLEEDGDMYVGQFNSQWQRHGVGEAWLADGTTYKGTFANDDFVDGTVRIPNGSSETTFVGKLQDESFVEGTLSQHDFTYTGAFQSNAPHGKGKLTFATGAEQTGTFRHGKLHGSDCTMKLEGGFIYVGEFVDGVIKRGTLYTPTYTYEGEFNEHGRAHGEGTQMMLATSPRLMFTGIWTHGQLTQGTCVDEHGSPVDWRDNHELHKAAADGDEIAVAATRYCTAKMKESIAMCKELESSFREDRKRVVQSGGKAPTMYDLGYEHGMTAGREALMGHVDKVAEQCKTRSTAKACHTALSNQSVREALKGCTVEVDEQKAMTMKLDQASAQQLVADRVEEQHQRFLKTLSGGAATNQPRRGLNIDGNPAWKSMTPLS
jgi:hypothetical protein